MATSSQKSKSYPRDILKRKTLILKSKLLNSPVTSPSICISSSSCFKSVCLHHWWLLRPQESVGLAVSGFSSIGNQIVRCFVSAAIAKRHDTTTLETVDGFTVNLTGFIDKSRSLDNGFSPEVSNHFLFGFPYNWKEYESEQCESRKASEFAGVGSCLQATLSEDDLPVTRNRDLLMFTFGESDGLWVKKSTLKDLSSNLGGTNFRKDTRNGLSRSQIDSKETSAGSDMDDEPHVGAVVADRMAKVKKFKGRSAETRTEGGISMVIDRRSKCNGASNTPIRITRSVARMMKLKEHSETLS